MVDAERMWENCLDQLRRHVPESTWNSCFQASQGVAVDLSLLTVAVPSSVVRDRIVARWMPQVRSAMSAVGTPDIEVEFDVRTNGAGSRHLPHTGSEAKRVDTGVPPAREAPELVPPRVRYVHTSLNDRYTFEAFIPGPSNRFAHAAALAVAETPGKCYNPLFIYGAAGLGKTHLLQAIAHYIHENLPAQRVRYVSCEAIMNDFVDSIRTKTMTAFKRRYRDVDVLLIDDIQFMEGKEGLQEELFHTFNDLHGADKQIVFSCDRPPKDIPNLEDRLRSRFEWGLIIDVKRPDFETRLAIARKKAERQPVRFPDEVLDLLATQIKNNIRELEGSIIRLSAYASLYRVPLTVELTKTVLGDVLGESRERVITAALIIEETALMFGFDVEELKGRSRRRPLVTARQVAMYVCRAETELSYPAIARAFGGRDHTTVIHAFEKITALMSERHAIYDQVTALIQRIRGTS